MFRARMTKRKIKKWRWNLWNENYKKIMTRIKIIVLLSICITFTIVIKQKIVIEISLQLPQINIEQQYYKINIHK